MHHPTQLLIDDPPKQMDLYAVKTLSDPKDSTDLPSLKGTVWHQYLNHQPKSVFISTENIKQQKINKRYKE